MFFERGWQDMSYIPDCDCFRDTSEGMAFLFDFGFIRSTLGDDGRPLEVLVIMDSAVFPRVRGGCANQPKWDNNSVPYFTEMADDPLDSAIDENPSQ
jgi:hypothetical protein